ncbi:MAG: universal stress protein [Steroidobacteraceae bacterium]|nr:universal stress protein [Steroidobacteraceae bacterium]
MKRLDRILAVLDPTSEAQPALAKAATLARRCGATLELFICDFDPSLSGHPFFDTDRLRQLREEFVSERLEYLEEAAEELRDEGLAVETHVHWDNPVYRGIVRRVEESSPDLVVKDTHYHTALRRALLTNTDWSLIRACPAPLLLARTVDWPESPRVLAALDPEHLGDKPAALDHDILEWSELLAARMGGEVHAVHAFFPAAMLAATATLAGMPLASGMTAVGIVEAERKRIGDVLAGIAAAHGVAPERVHLEQGAATEVLPRVARELGAALVVMGAVSRSRLQEVFLGSTAERVLDRIACDVWVAKPGDFSEKLPF